MSAESRVQDTITRMVFSKDLRFWGSVCSMIPIRYTKDVPTGALSYIQGSDSPSILLNPDYIEKLSMSGIAFLLIHEAKHYLFLHPWQRKGRDQKQFNIEADRYINSGIAWETRACKKLASAPDNIFYIEDDSNKRCNGPDPQSNPCKARSVVEIYEDSIKRNTEWNGEATQEAKDLIAQVEEAMQSASETGEVFGQWDSHDSWDELTDNVDEEEAKQQVARICEDAADAAGMGTMPSEIAKLIEGFNDPTIQWKKHIRAWVARSISSKRKLSWARLNKAMPSMLPGNQRDKEASVGFVMDVSGSISPVDFVDFNSEAIEISKRFFCKLIQVDTEIKGDPEVYKGRKIKQSGITRRGAGGTDMNPGIKLMMEDPAVSMVVLFTDGYIPDLDESTICKPLLVVITRSGKTLPESSLYKQLQIPTR